MGTIHIRVQDLYPSATEKAVVCDNTYTVAWDLGSEWDAYADKTMRCIWPDGTYEEVDFTGNEAEMPACPAPGRIEIGLYAGDIRTTRPAELNAFPSILSASGLCAACASTGRRRNGVLSDGQKTQIKALMDAYVDSAKSTNIWKYVGNHTRNDYAASSTTKSDGLNKSNCETFAQNIWMGRSVNDYKKSTYTGDVTKAFDWGYFFQFAYRKAYNLKYAADASDPSKVLWPGFVRANGDDYVGSYSNNSHYDSGVSDPQRQSPESWMVAGDMAYELMLMGCEISAHEMQVGDMLFFRAASLQDGVADAFQNQQFRNISHVGLCYGFDGDGRPIICECTSGWNDPIMITGLGDDCEALLPTGHSDNRWVWTRTRAAALSRRLVMVARHPAAFGRDSNVPGKITVI